jgi:hypothetical protein
MQNYDFLVLSPYELENLSRDLLQKKLSVFIESFTSGRDSGIDLRYTKDKAGTTIIQVKRYEKYAELLSALKKEIKKVKDLNPERYIICTSVGLTPANKNKINQLFAPYILSNEDILGKNDLNNLIGQYPEIEEQYYKLWLASTPVLKKILHSKIYNQSAFELDSIKEGVRLYVQNNSFNEAIRILKDYNYVIISGIPGIGKTTLSRILILYLLSHGYKEFVYLSDSINEGYEFFDEQKHQVFFFDDFLGKNVFLAKQYQGVDDKIVKFIEKIKKTPNKLLIFSTREYILRQAMTTFESFSTSEIEMAKCVIDLSSYTNFIKAQILYNHLFFAQVPEAHLNNLIAERRYLKLIQHKNYNPRIIETIINRKIWLHCQPNEFSQVLISFFDNPESVWLYAFENSVDRFSQFTLLTFLTMGTPVMLGDLENALKTFLRINNYKYFIAFDSITFKKAIKELENTFIITQKDDQGNIVVEYQNPSIQDFLVNYLSDKEDLIHSLLSGAIFTEQFFTAFVTKETPDLPFIVRRQILLSDASINLAIERILSYFDNLISCRATKFHYKSKHHFFWGKDDFNIYGFLKDIFEGFGSSVKITRVVHDEFQKRIVPKTPGYFEQRAYVNLLKQLDKGQLTFNENELIDSFVDQLDNLEHIEVFRSFEEVFPTAYQDKLNEQSFGEKLAAIIQEEISATDESNLDDLKNQIEDIESSFQWTFYEEKEDIDKKIKEYDRYIDSQVDGNLDEIRERQTDVKIEDEGKLIDNLFISLVDNK